MKGLIYKMFLDNKWNLILSTLVMVILFYTGVENLLSGFVWIAIIGKNDSKEDQTYFRTMNFKRNEFFQAKFIFPAMKLIIRLFLVFVIAMVIPKSLADIIYFIGFLYIFFVIETALDLSSESFSGKEKKDVVEIVFNVLIFLIIFGVFIWFTTKFYWPMEKLVYGGLLLTVIAIVYVIYQVYKYKGVHYVENTRLKL